MENNNLDILAIGDITTDAFIKVKDVTLSPKSNDGSNKICFRFGEKIPYESVDIVAGVGNSANAAMSASRLGLMAGLKTEIGDDKNGEDCLDVFKKANINISNIKIHPNKKTNYHYVIWYEDDRTILIKHEKFDYNLEKLNNPRWIYLSSLGENSLEYHNEIGAYLNLNPEVKLAFQPGTFQIKLGRENLQSLYKRTEIFFSNITEAMIILESNDTDIKNLLLGISKLGPKIVIITDGPKGAYVFDGGTYYFMPPYPDIEPPKERTGAGDAFSSTVTSAMVLGLPLEQALLWGPINSMSVVQYIGAQRGLLTRKEIERYLEKAPADYLPRKI